ncbi:MAG TPA: hypothetical protein PK993_03405 [Clostridia bacterium]|nr:hypothetical protein [Clostridia bacterium]
MKEPQIELVLDKVFNEHYGKNKIIFESYEKIYNLPKVECECKVSKK